VSDFFTVVAADLVLLAVTFAALMANVVATVASLFLLLAVSSQMTDSVTFVALLASEAAPSTEVIAAFSSEMSSAIAFITY